MKRFFLFFRIILIFLFIITFCFPFQGFSATVEIISAPTYLPRNCPIIHEYSPGLEIKYSNLPENKFYTIKLWLLERTNWYCASTQYCEKTYYIDNTNGSNKESTLYLKDTIDIHSYATFDWVVRLYDGKASYDNISKRIAMDEQYATGTGNRPPKLYPIGNKTCVAGTPLKFKISASDLDNNSIKYTFQSAIPLPGAAINQSTGEFVWTPEVEGIYTNIKFQATDNGEGGMYDTEFIDIQVEPAPECSIALNPIGNKRVCIGNTVDIPLSAYNPDLKKLTFGYTSNPPLSGVTFDPSTGHFEWTPAATVTAVDYTVTFTVTFTDTVTDGICSDNTTITIEVINECASDPYLSYLLSSDDPWIWVENELMDGNGGKIEVAMARSFYDPMTVPGYDYTKLRKGGEQYALDSIKTEDGTRVISDSENLPPDSSINNADGFSDGLGDSSSLYDMAMTIICLTHAGKNAEIKKILNAYDKKAFLMLDSTINSPNHPLDQGELFTVLYQDLIGISFDKYIDNGEIPSVFDEQDQRAMGYPGLSPGYEFGAYIWTGGGRLDDDMDMPRVSEFNDAMDIDDDNLYFPYKEKGVFYRPYWPYTLFFRWTDLDTPVIEGGPGQAQRLLPDKLIPYSLSWKNNEYTYRSYDTSSGDSLWFALSILYYTSQTKDTHYLPLVYQTMDTIADNFQDFNGGIHFGYYSSMELTPESTEHAFDWIFCWSWIEKLYQEGLVDEEHYQRYQQVTNGNINLTNEEINIISISDNPSDDEGVKGADLLLRFLGIPHSILEITSTAATINLQGVKVILLPNTPYTALTASMQESINTFIEGGGCALGSCDAGLNNDLFGVSFSAVKTIDTRTCSIVADKVYKDGIDNPSGMMDLNSNGMPGDMPQEIDAEPPEADNWQECDGRLTFAFTAAYPYTQYLLWSNPDYKRSRLTYYLNDQSSGTEFGGHTPDLLKSEDPNQNYGNAITTNRYVTGAVNHGANSKDIIAEDKVCMLRAKIIPNGINHSETLKFSCESIGETLYFTKKGKGKTLFFTGDMFGYFYRICSSQIHDPYSGIYIGSMQSTSQIAENAFTWFFTAGLEPFYTIHPLTHPSIVYDEGDNQGGAWSGWMGSRKCLKLNTFCTDSPYDGNQCVEAFVDANGLVWTGIFVSHETDPNRTWYSGPGIGANLTGARKLRLAVRTKEDGTFTITVGMGFNSSWNDPMRRGDSAHIEKRILVNNKWQVVTIEIPPEKDLSHINGLFFFTYAIPIDPTFYFDRIEYLDANDNHLAKIYKDDLKDGNLSPTLWRDKGLKHFGVKDFLKRCVWAGSEDGLLIPPGADGPGRDENHDGRVDDWQYESANTISPSDWQDPYNWQRKDIFIRGELDWVKAMDLGSWGALVLLLQGNTEDAKALMEYTEKTMLVTVSNQEGHSVTAFEYWDLPNSGSGEGMDDFGESIWLEGTAQMAYTYYVMDKIFSISGMKEKGDSAIFACDDPNVSYLFSSGTKGVPYSWPRNMIVDKRGPGDADNVEREDALSIASTTWTYIAKNRVPFLPIQNIQSFKCGDADGNETVDIWDAWLIARCDAALIVCDEMPGYKYCDVNLDGKVDIWDAWEVALYDARIVDALRCKIILF